VSRTRQLIEELRGRLGAAAPMAPPPEAPQIPPPPRRVFPKARERSAYADEAAQHTTALVGIGHVGTRYATDVVLQFQAELAVAHEAVATELPDGWAEDQGLVSLQSRATSHREFLLRPDYGRRLSDESLERLRNQADRDVDVQLILADGLSAVACMQSGTDLLRRLKGACEHRGLRVGTPVCAKYARVWLQDEIGQELAAKVAVILLGERPGLGTGDGLSAYVVYEPRIGKTDGDRNMMSNIHARGVPPEQAAQRLARMIEAMLEQATSGVELDIRGVDAGAAGYRAPQVRTPLVEVMR